MMFKLKLFLDRYGIAGCIVHIYWFIITKVVYSGARLIRQPIEIRGRKSIDLGHGLTTGSYCRIEAAIDSVDDKRKKIVFGKNVILNDNVHIASVNSVKIGDDVLIASKVFISDHNHGIYKGAGTPPDTIPNERPIVGGDVVIENNAWIGEFVAILPGVVIGEGSIVGAMSVVTKSVPKYSIVVGSPAKVIKTYNFNNQRWEKVIS